MSNPKQLEFGENGAVISADPLRDIDIHAGPNVPTLEWRAPLWLIGLLVWLFAGPLNPAAFFAYFILDGNGNSTMLLISLPSALGVALVLWRILGRPISLAGLFGSVFGWAAFTIPLYMGLFLGYTMGAQGLEESVPLMFAKGASGLFLGFGGSLIYGWIGFLFALPAALAASLVIRTIGLKLIAASKTAAHYTPKI